MNWPFGKGKSIRDPNWDQIKTLTKFSNLVFRYGVQFSNSIDFADSKESNLDFKARIEVCSKII